jgi:CubicO group peptidase (beta-lactamase class C family)
MTRRSMGALLAAALMTWTLLAGAQALPRVAPEAVGLSPERLALLSATVEGWVARKEIPGAVTMVARRGRVAYVHVAGWRDAAARDPLREDAIFRLYSMTKPVVSIAAMQLVEDGRLALNEPVHKYIPEFKDMKVATESVDAAGNAVMTTAPAKRAITVQDLLRHTSGITYGPPLQTRTLVQKMYAEAGIWSQQWVLADFARALARLPLMAEPGSTWEYGHNTDILGRVVEVAAGKPLDAVLDERILRPLGMTDTAFQVPPEKAARLAQPQPDPYSGQTPDLLDVTQPATFFAGGHGLVGTAADYLRFGQMLLDDGRLGRTRIIGPRTLAWATSDHLHAGIAKGPNYLPGPGYGFGLGFGVRTERGQSAVPGSPGEFFWGGYAGTAFWIDPKEDLVVVFMTTEPTRRAAYRAALRSLVYGAIDD